MSNDDPVPDAQVLKIEAWAKQNGVAVPTVLPGMPDAWFAAKFPALPARYGSGVLLGMPAGEMDGKRPFVKDLGEDFLAACR
jgi:hypothetical protein